MVILLVNSFTIKTYASDVEDNDRTDNEDPIIMVSLGDSYSSGKGIEKFYGQDDDTSVKINNPDWLAHRSQNSWSGMLHLTDLDGTMASHKDENWFFVAASGAVTDNLLNLFEKKYKKDGYEGSYSLEPQLNVIDQFDADTVDYVTLTFGGNDVGFSNIIITAVSDTWLAVPYLNPSKLSDNLNETWESFYAEEDSIKENITNAYINIAERAGANADIIVAGYPKLLDQNGKGIHFTKKQAEQINSNVGRFNQALNEIVGSCSDSGMNIFISSQ